MHHHISLMIVTKTLTGAQDWRDLNASILVMCMCTHVEPYGDCPGNARPCLDQCLWICIMVLTVSQWLEYICSQTLPDSHHEESARGTWKSRTLSPSTELVPHFLTRVQKITTMPCQFWISRDFTLNLYLKNLSIICHLLDWQPVTIKI